MAQQIKYDATLTRFVYDGNQLAQEIQFAGVEDQGAWVYMYSDLTRDYLRQPGGIRQREGTVASHTDYYVQASAGVIEYKVERGLPAAIAERSEHTSSIDQLPGSTFEDMSNLMTSNGYIEMYGGTKSGSTAGFDPLVQIGGRHYLGGIGRDLSWMGNNAYNLGWRKDKASSSPVQGTPLAGDENGNGNGENGDNDDCPTFSEGELELLALTAYCCCCGWMIDFSLTSETIEDGYEKEMASDFPWNGNLHWCLCLCVCDVERDVMEQTMGLCDWYLAPIVQDPCDCDFEDCPMCYVYTKRAVWDHLYNCHLVGRVVNILGDELPWDPFGFNQKDCQDFCEGGGSYLNPIDPINCSELDETTVCIEFDEQPCPSPATGSGP